MIIVICWHKVYSSRRTGYIHPKTIDRDNSNFGNPNPSVTSNLVYKDALLHVLHLFKPYVMSIPKILIVGTGGVGVIVSFGLLSSGSAEVTSIVRSQYDIVRSQGYTITSLTYGNVSNFRPANVVKDVKEAISYGPFNYIIVSTKNTPEIFKVEDLIEPVVSCGTSIVLIQNGIGIEEGVIQKFPKNVVLSGVSQMGSVNKNALVNHSGGVDRLSIGYFGNKNLSTELQEKVARKFVDIYSNKHNICAYVPDVKYMRWKKLVYNASLNSVCALSGVDIGRLEAFGGMQGLVRPAMKEIISIAKADGIILSDDLIEEMIRIDDGKWYKPSMLIDLENDNYMEIVNILGNPLRIAAKANIPAPYLTVFYEMLLVIQKRIAESKGRFNLPSERPGKYYRVDF